MSLENMVIIERNNRIIRDRDETIKEKDKIIKDLQEKLKQEKGWKEQFESNYEEIIGLITDIYNAFVKVYPYALKNIKQRAELALEKEKKEKQRMGVDCYIYDRENYCSLDRWYVFSEFFEQRKEYSKEDIINRLEKLKRSVLMNDEEEWSYYEHWIETARKIVERSKSDVFIFYTDNDMPEEFYSLVEKKDE